MFKKFLVAAIIALGIASSAHAQHAAVWQPKVKVIGDWAYNCRGDEARKWSCEAVSLPPKNSQSGIFIPLKVSRFYMYKGKLDFPNAENTKAAQYKVSIDGKLVRKNLNFFNQGSKSFEYDSKAAMEALRLGILRGKELSIQNQSGDQIGLVSLKGSFEVLKNFDDAQQLSGHSNAFIYRGGKNLGTTVSIGPGYPGVLKKLDDIALNNNALTQSVKSLDCGGQRKPNSDYLTYGIKNNGEQTDEVLLLINCGKEGINTVFKPYIALLNAQDGQWAFTPGTFNRCCYENTNTMSLLYNVELNNGEIISTRYLNDEHCGDRHVFEYNNFRGKNNKASMISYSYSSEMPVCRGAKHWITVD
jgi:hypothetical protein